jgi:hypothetical protein
MRQFCDRGARTWCIGQHPRQRTAKLKMRAFEQADCERNEQQWYGNGHHRQQADTFGEG